MLKGIKAFFLGVFLISPIILLALYTVHTTRQEKQRPVVKISNLKFVPPVAIIDEIVSKIEEEDLEDALSKINSELPDPNIPSSGGTPLIVLASEKDYTDIVSALIQRGANPDKPDLNTSETALIKAVRNQNLDTITVLLNAGANPNLGTNQGLTPLDLAIDLKNEDLATLLLSSGATNGINKGNLFLYVFKKNPIGVNIMLSGGMSPNVTDEDNNTPLIIAAANGDLESIKSLISYRAEVNVKNKHGMTPLLYAVKGKYWNIADYLINSGAKINASNIYGQNALFWAAYHGNAKVVHDLLVRGANYRKKTRLGQTALQMARAFGHVEAAKMIEDFIAYKNLPRDSKGNIILPKIGQQTAVKEYSSPMQSVVNDTNTNIGKDISNDLMNQVKQDQHVTESAQPNQTTVTQQAVADTVVQNQGTQDVMQGNKQVQNITQQNKLPASNNQVSQQQPKTQINTLQSTTANQPENPQMPQMPGGMDMSAIMSMMGGGAQGEGGAPAGGMGEMLKQMQSMGGGATGNDSANQQMPSMPTDVQMPAGMDMSSISKMIPAGTLPEGMDLSNLSSMNPEQLKKMGVPEDQIANITQAQKMGQLPNGATSSNGMQPKDLSNMSSTTYQNGIPKTQINKLQTSNN